MSSYIWLNILCQAVILLLVERTWSRKRKISQRRFFINPFPHEHIVKNGRFHWKASCYKFKLLWNYEKCFNTNQTWHKCWLDHCLCNDMLSLKFPVTMTTRRLLTIAKNHFFDPIFPSKFISKCCNFSMDWDRVKCFSAWLHVTLWSTWGHFKPLTSPKFFGVEWDSAPLQTPQTEGGTSPSGNPLMYLLDGGGAEKVLTFLATFLKRKHVFGAQIEHFFTILDLKRGEGS
jgi:hypothetical protein